VKQVTGILAVIAGIITATAVTCIAMIWWGSADIIRNIKRR
jgi:hypothetical protein